MTTPDNPTWHVLGDQITEDTQLSATGTGLAQVYVVPYVIDSGPARGHRGTVKVAPADFTEQHVRDLITGAVGRTHAVAGLGSDHAGLAE